MGVLRLDRAAVAEIGGGALWAIPVIALTVVVSNVLLAIFPVTPVSPLPLTPDLLGFALSLLAGVLVAPFGEEILFRAFATTAWVRGMGLRRGVIQAALVFAFAHVLTVSGSSAGEAFGLAVVGFGSRIPIALALGVLFARRRHDLGLVRAPRHVQRHPAGHRRDRQPLALSAVAPGRAVVDAVSRGAPRVEPPVRARR